MTTVHTYVHSTVSDPLRHVKNDRFRESRRPKVVVFYPNGKPNYKPQQLRITPHKYNSFNDLLKELTKTVKLPFGVRRVYTPTGGTEIDDLDDIEDGNTYLCASFERFKPAQYGKSTDSRPEWGPAGATRPNNQNNTVESVYTNLGYTPSTLQQTGGGARGAGFRQYYYRGDRGGLNRNRAKGTSIEEQQNSLLVPPVKRTSQKVGTFGAASRDKYAGSMGHLGTRAPLLQSSSSSNVTGYAKKFRIVYDKEPGRGYDFVFKENTSDSLDRILDYVGDRLKHQLKKFFTVKNREIKSLRDLYKCPEEVLIATAKDQITEATLKAVQDAIYNLKNTTSSTMIGASKNDSGFGEEAETIHEIDSDLERTPRLARKQQQQQNHHNQPQNANRINKTSNSLSPSRKQPTKRGGGVLVMTSEDDDNSNEQSSSQVIHQQQRKLKEKENREKERLLKQELQRQEEEKRKKRQQARIDNENRRRLKRLQSDKPKIVTAESNKENKKPTSQQIRNAEQAEKERRMNSVESAAVVKHEKNEDSLKEQAERAEQKRKRLAEEKERRLKQDAIDKEEERKRMERDLKSLADNGNSSKNEARPVDEGVQFEEANFIKKKKVNGGTEGPKILSFDSEEKILRGAEESERERAKREKEAEKEKNEDLIIELENAEKLRKKIEAEEEAERERKKVEEEAEQRRKKEEQLAAEEEAKRLAAEEEAKRLAAEEEAKRLEEEATEKARKTAALEEAARLRKVEEERQAAEEERLRKEKEAEEEKEREREREEQERKKQEEEAAELERKRKEEEAAAEEKARKEREKKAAEEEEKRKQEEAEKKALADKEKEKNRPKGLILPIHEEEEIERKYELKKKMGDGNFANVYQAVLKEGSPPPTAPPDTANYAVKQIDKSKVIGSRKNTSSKVQMLKNEIDIMKSCDHPNICKLYEAYETEKHVYLIMEFVKGGDLFDAISENVKFDEPQSSLIIRHLAEALDYLHSRKIVHRDIKPENLLVDKDEKGKIIQVKLGDFGLAMYVKEKIYSVCGTPTYVAPEILAETGYGLEVDNWATGVISYILMCGFPPFRSIERNQDELFDTIQRGEFEYLSPYWDNISDTAKDLIDQLLVVEIRKRMKSKDVLKHKFLLSHKQ